MIDPLLSIVLIAYFTVKLLLVAGASAIGMRELRKAQLLVENSRHMRSAQSGSHPGVSLLIPVTGEGDIRPGLRRIQSINHPELEVIVTGDLAAYDIFDELRENLGLVEVNRSQFGLNSAVIRVFRARNDARLLVLDNPDSSLADSLQLGLEVARNPLICSLPLNASISPGALVRASFRFAEDPELVAISGPLLTADDETQATTLAHEILNLELAREALLHRALNSKLRPLLELGSGFNLIRRSAALAAGGYTGKCSNPELDLLLRIQQECRKRKRTYGVKFHFDFIGYSSRTVTMRRVREQWAASRIALLQVLWNHRTMILNPRFGRIGLAAFPLALLRVIKEPLLIAAMILLLLATLGQSGPNLAITVVGLAFAMGIVESMTAICVHMILRSRTNAQPNAWKLLGAALLENLAMRQLAVLVRLRASLIALTRL